MVSRTARPDLFHRRAKQLLPHARRSRHCGDGATTAKQIAAEVGVSPATVSRILRRFGLNKLSALEPAEPIRRATSATIQAN